MCTFKLHIEEMIDSEYAKAVPCQVIKDVKKLKLKNKLKAKI